MIDKLQDFLAALPLGPISDTSNVAWFLANAWSDLGGDDSGIDGRTLFCRMAAVIWNPPLLTFTIEQHGSRHFGSTAVTLQDVTVNLAKRTVSCTEPRSTQRHYIPPRLGVGPIADEIAFLIVTGKEDHRLQWCSDDRLRAIIGDILPDGLVAMETLDARRKRLKSVLRALTERLAEHGWRGCGGDVYETIKEQPR